MCAVYAARAHQGYTRDRRRWTYLAAASNLEKEPVIARSALISIGQNKLLKGLTVSQLIVLIESQLQVQSALYPGQLPHARLFQSVMSPPQGGVSSICRKGKSSIDAYLEVISVQVHLQCA